MLKILFGKIDDVIFNTSLFFKNTYEPEWIVNEFSQKIIEDVDKSRVLGTGAIDSPVLGIIPPTALSGGTKTLLLINNRPDLLFNASNCGDNCAKWLLEMGKIKDVRINLRHLMNFGDEKFEIYVENTDSIVRDMGELVSIAGGFV